MIDNKEIKYHAVVTPVVIPGLFFIINKIKDKFVVLVI